MSHYTLDYAKKCQPSMLPLIELSKVIQYQNDKVVTHFCHLYPEYTLTKGRQLFVDLMSWLWLKQTRERAGKVSYLFGPLLVLDELWHCFILYTRDYNEFSLHYFGEYLHHDPEPIGKEHKLNEVELTDFLSDCFLHLGESWVDRYFSHAFDEDDHSP